MRFFPLVQGHGEVTCDWRLEAGRFLSGGLLLGVVVGCGAEHGGTGDEAVSAYATQVISFAPGAGAGFNQGKLPDIVLGPPRGLGTGKGSLDVLSLGVGGEITLAFGDQRIVDGVGPDLIVFENAFWPGGDPSQVYAELGEVSVSEDGETWHAFECDVTGDGLGHFRGCAGATPTLAYDAQLLLPPDPSQTGGDAFDLSEVQLTSARYVKLRDLATLPPGGTTSGFDLDAVAVVHAR